MPPLASWFRGHPDLEVFLRKGPLSGAWRWRHLATTASGHVAVGCYTWREDEGCYRPFALDVLTLRAEAANGGPPIQEVTAFLIRESPAEDDREMLARYPDQPVDGGKVSSVFERLGLPDRLD
jgi:RNA polymerase sigma-70 factor (ECF subfamily)